MLYIILFANFIHIMVNRQVLCLYIGKYYFFLNSILSSILFIQSIYYYHKL